MKKIIAAVVALCGVAGTAYAADTRAFEPKGPWTADYADDYCRLSRTFSNGSDEVSLALDRIQPGLETRMIVSSASIKVYRSAKSLHYHYLPAGEDRQTQLLRSELADGTPYLIVWPAMMSPTPKPPVKGAPPSFPPPYSRDTEQAFAGGVTGVAITDGIVSPIELDTGNLKPVFAALQSCSDDLVSHWGIDVGKLKTAKRMVFPNGDTSKWLPAGTIGFGDFAKLSGGVNQIRLMVDATGKPTDCKIDYPTLDVAVNDKICKAMLANATFMPALDADGQAFASYYTTSPLFLFGPPGGGFGGR